MKHLKKNNGSSFCDLRYPARSSTFATEVTCTVCLMRAVVHHEKAASDHQIELQDLRRTIERVIETAETIREESATHTPYIRKVVLAQELRDVLDGRITG